MASKTKQKDSLPTSAPLDHEPTDDQLRIMLEKQGKSTSGTREQMLDRLAGEPVDWTADK